VKAAPTKGFRQSANKGVGRGGRSAAAAARSSAKPARPAKAPRSDNRLPQVLDAAAALFAQKGYQAASIRDIVKGVGMLPGSLYYHFANKDELLTAVYGEGVRRISAAVEAAVARHTDPWLRLEAACVAHLESLLDQSAYAKVVISVQPADVPQAARALIALRDGYERQFVALITGLPLPARLRGKPPRTTLRLLLLGALNWAPTWYQHGGTPPRRIARDYIALLRAGLSA
jgi:AcrR family transcriptional regulator